MLDENKNALPKSTRGMAFIAIQKDGYVHSSCSMESKKFIHWLSEVTEQNFHIKSVKKIMLKK
jgi:hypothetical protein